jgi:hypothetical protein
LQTLKQTAFGGIAFKKVAVVGGMMRRVVNGLLEKGFISPTNLVLFDPASFGYLESTEASVAELRGKWV